MKKGLERAPHRSLFKALGLTDKEIEQPMIGIANSANEVIPGHLHLHQISDADKAGIRMAGGTPLEFCTIGICDGIVMGHIDDGHGDKLFGNDGAEQEFIPQPYLGQG